MKAMSKTKMGSAIIKKIPALNKAFKKIDILQPGKDIPGISAKGIRIRAEALLKKLNPKIKFPPPKPKFKKIKTKVKQSDIQDLIRRGQVDKLQEFIDAPIKKGKILNRNVPKGSGDGLKIDKKIPDTKNTSKNIDEFNLFDNEIFKNLKGNAGGTSGGDIALAPTNNIFLINQDNSQKSSPPQTQSGDTIVIGGKSVNPYDISLNIAMMESLQTA